MLRRDRSRARRGGVLLETAIVMPAMIGLFLGMCIMGLGIYRYNEIAYLARVGSRWAAVHGPTYQADRKASVPTVSDVLNQAVIPKMSGLSQARLSGYLSWNTGASPATVTFRLNYQWVPEAFLAPVSFTSTSTQVISY